MPAAHPAPGVAQLVAHRITHDRDRRALFVLDGEQTPDPYARYLPYGVHGPAMAFAPIARGEPVELKAADGVTVYG